MMKIKLGPGAYSPEKSRSESEGFLLRAAAAVVLPPYSAVTAETGVYIALPFDYYGLIRSISTLSAQGIISSGRVVGDLQSSIKVRLFNISDNAYTFDEGDIIANLIIRDHGIPDAVPVETEIIDEEKYMHLWREYFEELKRNGMLAEYDTFEDWQEALQQEESRASSTGKSLYEELSDLTRGFDEP